MRVVLAQPRGFCAGVERAIEIVERAIEKYGPPIYVRHEIVHNRHVVERLRAKGAALRRRSRRDPAGQRHHLQRPRRRRARSRTRPPRAICRVIDATCPLVSKVHSEGQRYANQGREIVLIGHAGHPEIEGTMGRIDGKVHLISNAAEVATLDRRQPEQARLYHPDDALGRRHARGDRGVAGALSRHRRARHQGYLLRHPEPPARGARTGAGGRCGAGGRRRQQLQFQPAARDRARSRASPAYLIADADALDPEWLAGARSVGITAGASAPEELVQELIDRLRSSARSRSRCCPALPRMCASACRPNWPIRQLSTSSTYWHERR